MKNDGVYVTGLRETIRSIERLGVEVKDLKAAFKKVGTLVANDAKSLAPQRTGRLAASIRPSNTKNKSVIRAGSARVPYAGVIHYGWPSRNIEPHPFLTTAVSRNRGKAIETIKDELNRLVRALGLK